MFCRFCGREIPDDSVFCCYCGKQGTDSGGRKTREKRIIVDVFFELATFYASSVNRDIIDALYVKLIDYGVAYRELLRKEEKDGHYFIRAKLFTPFRDHLKYECFQRSEKFLLDNGYLRTIVPVPNHSDGTPGGDRHVYEKVTYES